MLNYFFIFFIKLYKLLISPLLGKKCRFIPSCSKYCIDALENYTLLKSFKLILTRLARCRPYSSDIVYYPLDKIHK